MFYTCSLENRGESKLKRLLGVQGDGLLIFNYDFNGISSRDCKCCQLFN